LSVIAIVPTLGRPTLQDCLSSLEGQVEVIIKDGPGDTLIKIKEAVNQAKTEFIAIADDDAYYPRGWIQNLLSVYEVETNVGFVGGSALPYRSPESTKTERVIGEITTSFFGTSNMSYRFQVGQKIEDRDELNLIGNGMYKREVFAKILNEEFDRIPPSAWETYVFTRIRQLGYRTVYCPGGFFYHRQRKTVLAFAKQIYRSGMGRMNYFKEFPSEIPRKSHLFIPSALLAYLWVYFWIQITVHVFNAPFPPVWGVWPIIAYVLTDLLVCLFTIKNFKLRAFLMFPVLHFSYGIGMISGLFRNKRRWN
jgi:hypothetical protein